MVQGGNKILSRNEFFWWKQSKMIAMNNFSPNGGAANARELTSPIVWWILKSNVRCHLQFILIIPDFAEWVICRASDRKPAQLGAIPEKVIWRKSSGAQNLKKQIKSHCGFDGKFTQTDVQRANRQQANVLRVRSGSKVLNSHPSTIWWISEEVFISTIKGDWAKISLEDKWLE